jgi:hypothetical protein
MQIFDIFVKTKMKYEKNVALKTLRALRGARPANDSAKGFLSSVVAN